MLEKLKERARQLKGETYALYLAARDPRTPWYAKLFVAGIVAYALSPIDLIPDFVPILGYMDDLILVPLGIILAIKLIPHSVLAESRTRAAETIKRGKLVSRTARAIVGVIWVTVLLICFFGVYRVLNLRP